MFLAPQLDLVRASVTSDTWGRYYTSSPVSDTLVNAIHGDQPKLILELGVGEGAISSAAVRKWQSARLITVDADHSAKPTFIDSRQHTHHVHDALDDALAERIGIPLESVDVALCNPPYIRPRWRPAFKLILEEAGLAESLESVRDAGADLLFIAQNLRLLKKHGSLGLILPDGLITGEKFRGVRKTLLTSHSIHEVIQLPRRAFHGTEAQTHLLILSKCAGETRQVALRSMSIDGVLSSPIMISAEDGIRRLDYSYHSTFAETIKSNLSGKLISIGDICTRLIRGRLSSSELSGNEFPVFHLSDFAESTNRRIGRVPRRFLLSNKKIHSLSINEGIAAPGDILVGRIGRNLHEKVCIVEGGNCLISDCIFAVRVLPAYREKLLLYLTSNEGKNALRAASHGVGARYLSRADLTQITWMMT